MIIPQQFASRVWLRHSLKDSLTEKTFEAYATLWINEPYLQEAEKFKPNQSSQAYRAFLISNFDF
jgi:hypothetical protein